MTTGIPATPAAEVATAAKPSDWLGRKEISRDEISGNLVRRIAATFGVTAPEAGAALPMLWHWAFFHDAVAESGLGADGHPARGGFLPPAEGRNRMWAGGRLEFIKPLVVGAAAERVSTIVKVEEKAGRTGALLFVTVKHEHMQHGELAIFEEHDIVYREPTPPRLSDSSALQAADWSEQIVPSPTLLFRYSAITFNGHRIHYDWPYATDAEGYAGLVVHGPLISTLTLHAFVRANPQARIRKFSYRGVRPLISPDPFSVSGRITEPGRAELWASNQNGAAQRAEIEFE